MPPVSNDLRLYLRQFGQDHVLTWWDQLTDPEQSALLDQLRALDLEQLGRLYAARDESFALPAPERIAPVPITRLDEGDPRVRGLGEEALRRGEVAALVVAGGQGSRLGFEHPKGMFAISPVRNKTLFQIHAEKVHALSSRYGRPVPFLIMTSDATHDETVAYFREQNTFGLPSAEVFLFKQGTMPALDMATGRLLMETRGRLFSSPNGHGGTLRALADTGLLEHLERRGVRHVFYFQVDNPVVKIAGPTFLGHHIAQRAEVSTKVVPKEGPLDKLGNLVLIDGRCAIIEYSDLPESMARQTDAHGQLRFRAGNSAIHLFDVGFLRRVTTGTGALPFHVARKKVPYLNEQGEEVEPAKENALKFEMFIFDALPCAERWTVVETSRREEFEPLKNATGADSPQTVRQAISNLAADWLERAGVPVPRKSNGDSAVALEIGPLYALDPEELAAKVQRGLRIEGPTYLG
ncbi:MAG: UDPGP type 1 family protein [Gemmataceae bacterium]|nr:UDPGP type 1 family protein [Gemmataceae bacterium]